MVTVDQSVRSLARHKQTPSRRDKIRGMSAELLSRGIYTIGDAARLLSMSPGRLREWVTGHYRLKGKPLISSEIEQIDHRIALSFVNLVEARFIDAFSKYGVKVRSIRHMAEEARRILDHPHPFASEVIFQTDGQKIFMVTYEATRDPRLYDLKGKNWALPDVVASALKTEVLYGPSGLAHAWYPRKAEAPKVVVNPKIAFGQPALDESGVPTKTIADAVTAADSGVETIARWYQIPSEQVEQAVRFEKELITLH
jgi:uncharacterized protein (DUF433 family)